MWLKQVGFPLTVSVLVGIGSAAIMGSVLVVRLDERVSTLERDVARHEATIEKELRRMEGANIQNAQRTDDQERRLTHLETVLNGLRNDFSEVRADIKTLLHAHAAVQPR